MSETAANTSFLNKPWFVVVLLIIAVGEFFAGYYYWGEKNREIEALSITARDQKLYLGAAEAKMARLEKTIQDMEAAGVSPVAAGPDPAAGYAFVSDGVTSAWNRLLAVRRQFQGTPQGAEMGELLTTEDFNGVRGPEQKEIECFEALLASGEQPLLKAIFEHNAKEALRSGDLGNARQMMPGLENLLAFYITVGDEGSMKFVENFLTTGPAAKLLQTKYRGRYFTSAGSVVGPALDVCVAAPDRRNTGSVNEPGIISGGRGSV